MSKELSRFVTYYVIFVVSTIFLVCNIPYVKYALPIIVWLSTMFRLIGVLMSNASFAEIIEKLKATIRIDSIWLHKISELFIALSYSVVLYQQQYHITLVVHLSSFYLLRLRFCKNWIEYKNA